MLKEAVGAYWYSFQAWFGLINVDIKSAFTENVLRVLSWYTKILHQMLKEPCHVKHYCSSVPVIGLSLAVGPLIAWWVSVALPVFRHGAAVSRTGPTANCQWAIGSREGQTETGQVAVAPLEGLYTFQAVRAPWCLITSPVKPVLRLCHPHASLCQAVHLGRLVPLLLHTDGGSALGPPLTYVLRVADCLGWLTAAQELLITSALLEGFCAAPCLLSGKGRPVTFTCLMWAPMSESRCQQWGGVRGRCQTGWA